MFLIISSSGFKYFHKTISWRFFSGISTLYWSQIPKDAKAIGIMGM